VAGGSGAAGPAAPPLLTRPAAAGGAPMDSPFMIMGPGDAPTVQHHRRIGQINAKVLYFEGDTAQRQPPKAGLKPDDMATNEFVDMSIGVGA
jgi:hypothetical protein